MDVKKIKELLKIMDENDLAEISIKKGDEEVSLKKNRPEVISMPVVAPAPVAAPVQPGVFEEAPSASGMPANCEEITAPMVGTFYEAAAPGKPAFVSSGSTVKSGDVLCILEAMKIMNEMKSEVSGKIVKVLVENGQAVEFGQPMFWIER